MNIHCLAAKRSLGRVRAEVIFDSTGVFICCLDEDHGILCTISCSCIAFSCFNCGKKCLMYFKRKIRWSCKVNMKDAIKVNLHIREEFDY